ncbi:hypothetical protein LTR85_002014 [Meristemomyces frigidus]|nr:hypothetical protein LTR85_002014 [Meristemomyces frigidus]
MDNSPLARLPPELRNDIYELALTHDRPYIIPTEQRRRSGLSGRGLMRTCRTVRAETTLLFYASNDFVFKCDSYYSLGPKSHKCVKEFQAFAGTIGEANAAALRSVSFSDESITCLVEARRKAVIRLVLGAVKEANNLSRCNFAVTGYTSFFDDDFDKCRVIRFELDAKDIVGSLLRFRREIEAERGRGYDAGIASELRDLGYLEKELSEALEVNT